MPGFTPGGTKVPIVGAPSTRLEQFRGAIVVARFDPEEHAAPRSSASGEAVASQGGTLQRGPSRCFGGTVTAVPSGETNEHIIELN